MSYGLYCLGAVIAIGGLVYGGFILDVPTRWIVVVALVMLGAAVLSGVKATRNRDPS